MIKVRFFGSNSCEACLDAKKKIEDKGIKYEFIDALADDTQDFCDEHEVDELPHIQIVNSKTDQVIYEECDEVDVDYISEIVENQKG